MRDAEQQLRLYRLLVENSLGLMCIHDLDGVLLAINPAAARSLGYRPEDGVGKSLRDFLAPSVQGLFDSYLERIRGNPADSGLMRLQARDGTERIWFYRNVRYEEPGSAPQVLGHALDVTDQFLAEQALKESRRDLEKARDELTLRITGRTSELQRANEQLRDQMEQRKEIEEELLRARKMESLAILAGGIAHDFNNILTVVQGNLALVRMEWQSGGFQFELLDQIERACQRAASLTLQLLTFAKGGAPVRRPTSIADILEDCAGLAGAGSGVRFQLGIPKDLWAADGDAGQISQLFHNVLLNAREAMPGTGTVLVSAQNVTSIQHGPLSMEPGKYVRVSIQDRGHGISAEVVPKIFDPYFSTKKAGRGLGLTTAYSIAVKHQGHIAVESVPGAGSTFHIYLPASEQAAERREPSRQTIQTGSGRVLVMDDEAAIRTMMSRMLKRLGYDVECAAGGAEAIKLFEKAALVGRNFDAAVLDLTIPGGLGGKETAAILRKTHPAVKLIVSSGHSDAPILSLFKEYGFDDVITKPWSIVALSAVLKRLIGSAASGAGA